MGTRAAGKAGSWYEENPEKLLKDLNNKLGSVSNSIDGSKLPISAARIIIAPHAGYRYSGQCAAWAYRCLDLSQAKKIFILGPSHAYYLPGCAITKYEKWATPFGDFKVDQETLSEIQEATEFDDIPPTFDDEEHSLEMHLPYLWKRCQETFGDDESQFPPIVPMLIGDSSASEEKEIGELLLPYFKDPSNAFVISSDFCHWGDGFGYMPYSPANDPSKLVQLRKTDSIPIGPPIEETIRIIDEAAMDAVKSGSHDTFVKNLKLTKNTVCGRHPIGVAMAALELLAKENPKPSKNRFRVVNYDRSQPTVDDLLQRSVSYVSAYAIL